MSETKAEMLGQYRVLDLTDEKGWLCGKILGDLGADVIKIEPLGGDPGRQIGPFYNHDSDPEKSLFWFAFNTSKRGITLDIEKADDKEIFKRLVKTADFVIESFSPGYIDNLGLGYSVLENLNPGIILVSISPFGQKGPYKNYKAPDIVAWAMGGQMYSWGDIDRPPVHMSHHSQAYLHAAAEAAAAVMIALYQRQMTGEGQRVDVSIQEAVCGLVSSNAATFDVNKTMRKRGEAYRPGPRLPSNWPCKDGHVQFTFWLGGERGPRNTKPLINYMAAEGMADEFLKGIDWRNLIAEKLTQEAADSIIRQVTAFFTSHTKEELFKAGLKYDAQIYPVATTADIVGNAQLSARKFWVEVAHPELGGMITYPGAFAKISEIPIRISRRAPLIGEHNEEILAEEFNDITSKTLKPVKNCAPDTQPLTGVKVVDFTWLTAGPMITKVLADYGAEVVKIEGKSRPGGWRTLGTYVSSNNPLDLDRSVPFLPVESSKYSIALNIAKSEGKELAKRLISWADIVVDNYSGGSMDRMGFGYEILKKVNPGIIMLSTCMMGQNGPYATFGGNGGLLTALSGFTHITGWPDRESAELGVYTDYIAPHFGLISILAALDYRRQTGKGQHIDLSQYETGIQFMTPLILDWTANKRIANRMGNGSDLTAPHGVYRCRGDDRWCAIAVSNDVEWMSFCKVIGKPDWTNDNKFRTFKGRIDNTEELDKLINTWTINYSCEEVMDRMQANGVAAGAVQNIKDLLENDPQLKYRQYFRELDHAVLGRYRNNRSPFILSRGSCILRSAPLLGEHYQYVCKDILKMSDKEIAEMIINGVVE